MILSAPSNRGGGYLVLSEEEVLVLALDSPQRELEVQEAAELVRAALKDLEPPDQELFVRHYYYGQTVEEAAQPLRTF